jgi:hypothetical protein
MSQPSGDAFQERFKLTGTPREVLDAGVDALNGALARIGGVPAEKVQHFIDPRRMLPWAQGGPSVWSVGYVESAKPSPGHLLVTYGLSRRIDPSSPYDHELSIRVAAASGEAAPLWAVFLLRHLARYELLGLGSMPPREVRVGELMAFAEPISRAPVLPQRQSMMPDTHLRAVAVVEDRLFRTEKETGLPEVRRVYGLALEEQEAIERWSCAEVMKTIEENAPSLTTDLARPPWTKDARIARAFDEGSAREGSATEALVVAGILWARVANGHKVELPGGERAAHLARVARARLAFGRPLVVHGYELGPGTEVCLVPSEEPWIRETNANRLEVGVTAPAMPSLLGALEERTQRIIWDLTRD